MKGYFRIVKCINNMPEVKLINFGVTKNNKDALKRAEKELGCKFVYDGWVGNITIYKAYLEDNNHYVLHIDRN